MNWLNWHSLSMALIWRLMSKTLWVEVRPKNGFPIHWLLILSECYIFSVINVNLVKHLKTYFAIELKTFFLISIKYLKKRLFYRIIWLMNLFFKILLFTENSFWKTKINYFVIYLRRKTTRYLIDQDYS